MTTEKPVVKKDSLDYLTPDSDFVKVMQRVVMDNASRSKKNNKNDYLGTVEYRILGSTISKENKNNKPIKSLDINQMTADPFHDGKVDEQRVDNRGSVPFSDIATRVTLFLQSDGIYNVVFDTTTDHKIKASFLLRVDLNKSEYASLKNTQIEKNSNFIFRFNDRENLRDPVLVKALKPST